MSAGPTTDTGAPTTPPAPPFPPPVSRLLPPASCLLPPASCLLPPAQAGSSPLTSQCPPRPEARTSSARAPTPRHPQEKGGCRWLPHSGHVVSGKPSGCRTPLLRRRPTESASVTRLRRGCQAGLRAAGHVEMVGGPDDAYRCRRDVSVVAAQVTAQEVDQAYLLVGVAGQRSGHRGVPAESCGPAPVRQGLLEPVEYQGSSPVRHRGRRRHAPGPPDGPRPDARPSSRTSVRPGIPPRSAPHHQPAPLFTDMNRCHSS